MTDVPEKKHIVCYPQIQTLVLKMFELAVEQKLHLRILWVPRQLNQVADYFVKGPVTWSVWISTIQTYVFFPWTYVWRIFQIRNGSTISVLIGTMTMLAIWKINGDHPPYSLVWKAVNHIHTINATATLVFPLWTSASWWPMMVPFFQSHQVVHLRPSDRILHYLAGSTIPSSHLPRCQLLAMRFS